jgi:hypothetical protein
MSNKQNRVKIHEVMKYLREKVSLLRQVIRLNWKILLSISITILPVVVMIIGLVVFGYLQRENLPPSQPNQTGTYK